MRAHHMFSWPFLPVIILHTFFTRLYSSILFLCGFVSSPSQPRLPPAPPIRLPPHSESIRQSTGRPGCPTTRASPSFPRREAALLLLFTPCHATPCQLPDWSDPLLVAPLCIRSC